jgi:hypothetical protein
MKYVEILLHLSRKLVTNGVCVCVGLYVCVCVCKDKSKCLLFVTAGTTEKRKACFGSRIQVNEISGR